MKSRGGWPGPATRPRSRDTGGFAWGFTQVPVTDEVIDLFERPELIFREHRAEMRLCQLCRIGSVAQPA